MRYLDPPPRGNDIPKRLSDWLDRVWRGRFKDLSIKLSSIAQLTITSFLKITPLTTNKMVSVDTDNKIVSIEDLTNWIIGTTNQITVTDNGDGTVTLSTPQDLHTDADVEFDSAVLDDLTASRLTSSNANKKIVSVTDLTAWIAGTTNRVTVSDDGDGTITLSAPQDLHTGANVTFATAILNQLKIILDNGKIYWGAGDNMSAYYDGTDGHIKTNEVAPSDLLIDCGTDKTAELSETVWDDINFGAGTATKPAAGAPDTVTFTDNTGTDTGIATVGFAVGEKLSWTTEYLHVCKEGADFYFHVHVQCDAAPTGTDKAQFEIKYTINADGETCDPVTTITKEVDIDTQYQQVGFVFAAVSVASVSVGDQISVSLERIAASVDEYGGDLKLKTFGIHVQKNTLGSRQIRAK